MGLSPPPHVPLLCTCAHVVGRSKWFTQRKYHRFGNRLGTASTCGSHPCVSCDDALRSPAEEMLSAPSRVEDLGETVSAEDMVLWRQKEQAFFASAGSEDRAKALKRAPKGQIGDACVIVRVGQRSFCVDRGGLVVFPTGAVQGEIAGPIGRSGFVIFGASFPHIGFRARSGLGQLGWGLVSSVRARPPDGDDCRYLPSHAERLQARGRRVRVVVFRSYDGAGV